ncbi:MAPEG family protein [Marinomonas epiphytica]
MVSALYASLLALWLCYLVIVVVKARLKNQVLLGDGGHKDLLAARSAHSNAVETIPISLILLFSLEWNDGAIWLVHLLGCLLLVGRILHAHGILTEGLRFRKTGMQLTLLAIVVAAIANIWAYLLISF